MEATLTCPALDSGVKNFRPRKVAPRWVEQFYRGLSDEEKKLIRVATSGKIPLEETRVTLDEFFARAERGEVGFGELRDSAGSLVAFTFFEIETLRGGAKDFVSHLTVGLRAADRSLAETDMEQMHEFARQCGCSSMSMKTIRPGLMKTLTEKHGWFCSEIVLRKIL